MQLPNFTDFQEAQLGVYGEPPLHTSVGSVSRFLPSIAPTPRPIRICGSKITRFAEPACLLGRMDLGERFEQEQVGGRKRRIAQHDDLV